MTAPHLYPTFRRNGRTQYFHRAEMEKKLGRGLKPGEIVHHRDHDRHNFRRGNLELTTHLGHGKLHRGPRKFIDQHRVIRLYRTTASINATAKKMGVGRDRIYVVLRAHGLIDPPWMQKDTIRKRKRRQNL